MTDMTIKPAPVHRSVQVKLPAARAFEIFTAGMGRWWLPSHKIGKTAFKDVIVESRAGGRWFERGEDGAECDWGKVLVWQPPSRLVLAWQIDANWTYQPDLVTEVEIRFVEQAGGTRVELEHRGLEKYGSEAERVRAIYDSAGGWTGLLESFTKKAAVTEAA
jgi:uncharacterized protein YndB with AHSA1/START domain